MTAVVPQPDKTTRLRSAARIIRHGFVVFQVGMIPFKFPSAGGSLYLDSN
jgi:hypothetical protein